MNILFKIALIFETPHSYLCDIAELHFVAPLSYILGALYIYVCIYIFFSHVAYFTLNRRQYHCAFFTQSNNTHLLLVVFLLKGTMLIKCKMSLKCNFTVCPDP